MENHERQAQALQETLHHEIPLSQAMGLTVAGYDGACLTLRAPLAPNINHKSTAFAGSLNALTTLAGWGLIWLLTHEHDLPSVIVIQESATHYRRPVGQDFVAICHAPPARQIERFLVALRGRGRARLPLSVEILGHAGEVAVTFTGRYVAFFAHADESPTDEPPARL